MPITPPRETPSALGYRMPAEWEPHAAIWLSWPHDVESFGEGLARVEDAYVRLICEISASERVELFVTNQLMRREVIKKLDKAGLDLSRVRFHEFPYADVWFRDYGPTFILRQAKPRLAMVRWIFNAWGDKYDDLKRDTRVPSIIASALKLEAFEPGIIMEGGSIDVNGRGAVLTTEQCLLNRNRNPKLSRTNIEESLKENLGVSHVIWLGEGIAGDDTDGHVDDIARFTNPNTVVCAVEDNALDENYKPLKNCFEALCHSKDQAGQALDVVRLPMPERLEARGRRLPASYANFYIGNGVVLAPIFGCRQDDKALEILAGLFPGRRIAGILCRELVRGLGTLHCISQQQPKD